MKAMENSGALWATDRPATPKPKAKAHTKPCASTSASSTKRDRKAKAPDTDGEETTENAKRRKKAKVSPTTITEERVEVNDEAKNESEAVAAPGADGGGITAFTKARQRMSRP